MTATLDPVRSLEAHYYTSPAIYAQEQSSLFARSWQYAGHVTEVEKPGDYFTFEIAGQNLFCLRDRQGEIRVFHNVCQHRAHELVRDSGNAKLLVCPYHAWSYELSGELRSGPNVNAVAGFDRKRICLTPAKVDILHGFIFVNLDLEAEPLDEWYPGVREGLGAYVPLIGKLKPLEWIEIPENCNWKVSVENYSECYHCKLNHPMFTTGVVQPETYEIREQGYCLRHTTECQNLDQMSYLIDPDENPHAAKYSSWFLWPTFSFQVYPGNVLNTYLWRPTMASHVVVWRGWYTVDGVDSEEIRRLAVQDRATTVEEDIHLVESVQRGLNSSGYRPGPLVIDPKGGINSERSIEVLQGWMRAAVAGI